MSAFVGRRVLIVGPFDTVSGYGNDLCGLTRAFLQTGADVHLSPLGILPPIPREIAALLVKAPEPPFDLAVLHVDPVGMDVPSGIRRAARTVVGWTMWEWDRFDNDLYESEPLETRLTDLDLLLTYDPVSFAALDPYAQKASVPHRVLQGGYTSDYWKPIERDWSGTFRYGMVGRLHDRKNPFAAIKAFVKLKREHGDDFDAELHLKTTEKYIHPNVETAYPGVKVHYAWWTQKQLEAFYAQIHVLLAPSRGEGKNVPALEAQTTGIPVIATDIGGHQQWLSNEYGWALTAKPYLQPQGGCADVDVDELANIMFTAYQQRDVTKRKGEIASQVIPAMCDWQKVLEKLGDALRDVKGREPILHA